MRRRAAFVWRVKNSPGGLPLGCGNRSRCVLGRSWMQNRGSGRQRGHVGDLFSSFLKRRMGLPVSSRAVGLDQVPESLFPLLACRSALSLTGWDIAVAVLAFFFAEIVISRLLYRFRVRDRPY